MLKKNRVVVGSAAFLLMGAGVANAALADLTASVSFTDVITAIFAIGLLVIAVDLAQIGYMKARKMIRGAH